MYKKLLPMILLISISVFLFRCASTFKDYKTKTVQSTLRATDGGQESVAVFSDGQTLVVFAHQDDDVLWMLPFWPVASKFLLAAYPKASPQSSTIACDGPPSGGPSTTTFGPKSSLISASVRQLLTWRPSRPTFDPTSPHRSNV
jgi:hypothetical protein